MEYSMKNAGRSMLAAIMLVGVLGQTALAQSGASTDRNTLFFNAPPSVEEMAQHLFPSKSRGIIVPASKGMANTAASPKENSIGMPVLFHFGKTTLVESSKPFLDQVGKLLRQDDYLSETLIIEGHTDSVGSSQYNHGLSELRALAVKKYLISNYDIDPKRLFPQGMGETQLFNVQNPKSQENRRVEFLRFAG